SLSISGYYSSPELTSTPESSPETGRDRRGKILEECSRQQGIILRPPQRPSHHPYHNRSKLRTLSTTWRGKNHHVPESAQRSGRSWFEVSLRHNKQSHFTDQGTSPRHGTCAGKN